MAKLPWQPKRKKSPRLPKVRDCRPAGQRICERHQRIGHARLLERLSSNAAETRDVVP